MKKKCRRGKRITTLAVLCRVLGNEPSVWDSCTGGPLPSGFVLSWQLQYICGKIQARGLYRVVRP